MRAAGDKADDGFTLVETLVALVILAVSAGLLTQSIALATGQIRASRAKSDAEALAVTILAERGSVKLERGEIVGTDPATNLFWRFSCEMHVRADETKRADAALITVEIRPRETAAPLYKLATVKMQASTP